MNTILGLSQEGEGGTNKSLISLLGEGAIYLYCTFKEREIKDSKAGSGQLEGLSSISFYGCAGLCFFFRLMEMKWGASVFRELAMRASLLGWCSEAI
jgi:hypothetical protein